MGLSLRLVRATRVLCYTAIMGNLTISVDEEVLKRARIRALELGLSVNAILSDYLELFSGTRERREEAADLLVSLSRQSEARRGDKGWTREELHERK